MKPDPRDVLLEKTERRLSHALNENASLREQLRQKSLLGHLETILASDAILLIAVAFTTHYLNLLLNFGLNLFELSPGQQTGFAFLALMLGFGCLLMYTFTNKKLFIYGSSVTLGQGMAACIPVMLYELGIIQFSFESFMGLFSLSILGLLVILIIRKFH